MPVHMFQILQSCPFRNACHSRGADGTDAASVESACDKDCTPSCKTTLCRFPVLEHPAPHRFHTSRNIKSTTRRHNSLKSTITYCFQFFGQDDHAGYYILQRHGDCFSIAGIDIIQCPAIEECRFTDGNKACGSITSFNVVLGWITVIRMKAQSPTGKGNHIRHGEVEHFELGKGIADIGKVVAPHCLLR